MKSDEPLAVRVMSEIVKTEIVYHTTVVDFTEEPHFVPMQGTQLSDDEDNSSPLNGSMDLIDIDQNSDDSSNESSPCGVLCSYWYPKCGDSSILSRDTATAIATLTQCHFWEEAESRRWRLASGNMEAAIEKLERLEPMLVCVFRTGLASD